MSAHKSRLAVAIIAYNEAHRLRPCLESVRWCDQIIVVDGHSTDNTPDIAREFTSHVYLSDRLGPGKPGGFADQRNYAMSCTEAEWVFFLDADERFSPELADEILQRFARGIPDEIAAFQVRRKEHFFGVYTPYTHGESWLIRLMRKDKVRWNARLVHEGLEIDGRVESLHGHLLHYSKDSLSEYLATQNRYTTLEAEQSMLDGAPLASSPFSAMLRTFLNIYVYKKSYREGAFGLVMSLLFAQYSFLSWAKRWEVEMKAGRVRPDQPRQRVLESIAAALAAVWNFLSPPR